MLASLSAFLMHWGSAFWTTMREVSPFLVLGLFLAGGLHVLVPARVILWALGQGGWKGALRGAILGAPLPLCSCSVLPTAFTLRRQGASLSSTTAFAISTPETSVDALAVTAALLPMAFLGVRPVAAILLAVLVAVVVEKLSTSNQEQLRQNILKFSSLIDGSKKDAQGARKVEEICRVCGIMTEEEHRHGFGSKTRAIFQYAFGTFFHDVATWIVLGLAVAALVQILVPEGGLNTGWLGRHPHAQVALATILAIPLYSCATATTPLAAVLLAKGLTPGAALAVLLVGPATNIGTFFAFHREFGRRITLIFYSSLFLFCWALGIGLNFLWPTIETYPSLTKVSGGAVGEWIAHGIPGWVELGCSWLLLLLALRFWGMSLYQKFSGAHPHHDHHDHDHGHNHAHHH